MKNVKPALKMNITMVEKVTNDSETTETIHLHSDILPKLTHGASRFNNSTCIAEVEPLRA